MNETMILLITNSILIAWPILFFLIWHFMGYILVKRQIRLSTLFYVSREELWAKTFRMIFFYIGIPMTLLNAVVYTMMYYNATGLNKQGDKVLVIYLFLFGAGLSILYTSLMLTKHCFNNEKSVPVKIFQTVRLIIVLFQFIVLDGYMMMGYRMKKSIPLNEIMGSYGLIGFIVEIAIIIAILLVSRIIIAMAKKIFKTKIFPR